MSDARTQPAARTEANPRKAWPDVAKGACIILIVLWHVVTKHYQQVDWQSPLPFSAAWGLLGEQLLPLRMPLFFTIAGMFAVGAVRRPWRVLARTRVVKFAYLYGLWVIIHTAVMWFTPAFDTAHARDPVELLEHLTITPTNLWFLYALALYFTIARATRKVPTAWLLAVAFLLSAAAAADLLPDAGNRWQVFQNLFFFLAGLRLRPWIETVADGANPRKLAAAGAAYALALLAVALWGAREWWGVWPVVSIAATFFGILGSVLVTRQLVRTTRLLSWLGRRTLPVYIMHLPLLALTDLLLRGPFGGLGSKVALIAAIEPILVTAILIGLCLVMHRMLRAIRLGWLFQLPGPPARAGQGTTHANPAKT